MFDSPDFKELKKLYNSPELESKNKFSETLKRVAIFIDQQKSFDEGIEFFSKVNKTIAENPDCYRYIGNIYRSQRDFEKALHNLQKAATMSHGTALYFEILYNLGMLNREYNRLIQAKVCFEEVLEAHPQSAIVHNSLSCLLVYEGRFREGWKKHVWRIHLDSQMQELKNYFQLPEWENKTESNILILPEQGIGDKVMFSSFFSLLPKNKFFTAVVSSRLIAIFKRSFPEIDVIEGTQQNIAQLKQKHFDAYCFIGCLPRILRKSTPNGLAYLKAAPYFCKDNNSKTRPPKRRIGISWRGGSGIERERRSVDLSLWLPILEMPDVNFINLQYDVQQSELESIKTLGVNIFSDDTVNPLENFDAFSSLVSSCDIIITVDNSTAHLAGALGIPNWILLPYAPNWRWGENGNKSYWYQSAKLFRQNDTEDWKEVVKAVATQLKGDLRKLASNTLST